jgi:tRNA nucleotidyltransferase (CCA-adding enzyme)
MAVKKLLSLLVPFFPPETYLVGGFVRDYLLGKESKDIDLITEGNPEEIAQRVAKELKGNFFGFKKEKLTQKRNVVYTVIVPFEGEHYRVDISHFENLLEDLRERDFTINAMAINLHDFVSGKFEVIDPFGGQEDLKRKLIRAVDFKNLTADPLRMLRAYRFAQALDFKIDPALRDFVRKNAYLIKTVSKERIVTELLKATEPPRSHRFFYLLCKDNLLENLFRLKFGKPYTDFLKDLGKLEKFIISKTYQNLEKIFGKMTFLGEFSEGSVLKWLLFFYYQPYFVAKENIKSYPFGAEFEKYVLNTYKGFEILKDLNPENIEDTYQFLEKFKSYLKPIGVLSHIENNQQKFNKVLDFYLNKFLKLGKPLLSGREIIETLKVKPSPLIGKLLRELVIKQLKGEIKTKEEALNWLREYKTE